MTSTLIMALYTRTLCRALALMEQLARPASEAEASAIYDVIRLRSTAQTFGIIDVNGLRQYFNDEALLIGGAADGDRGLESSSSSSSSSSSDPTTTQQQQQQQQQQKEQKEHAVHSKMGDLNGDGKYSLADLQVLFDSFGEMEARSRSLVSTSLIGGGELDSSDESIAAHAAADAELEALA